MKKLILLTLVLSLVFAFPAAAEQSPEEIIEDYTYGGTVTIGETGTPEGMFNPLFAETVYDSQIWTQIFEGLTRTDENLEPEPALAEDWDISEDHLTKTFYLDEEAEFHDGEPVTAYDVKFTLETFVHPDYDGIRASEFLDIKGAQDFHDGEADEVAGLEVIDEHTIEIEMEEVYAPFMASSATYGIVPEHILGEYEVAEFSDLDFNYENPVGSGPFEFVEFVEDEYVHLSANEDYREGRPYVDDVIIEYVDDQALIMMLERGEIDYAPIQDEHFHRLDEVEELTLHDSITTGFNYLGFNLEKDTPLQEREVRYAIAHGFNRADFIDEAMYGLASVFDTPVPQGTWAFTEEGLETYEYDPEKARDILEEAGWSLNEEGVYEKDGEPLEFTLAASADSAMIDQMMALLQDNLSDVGMDVEIERREFPTLIDEMDAGELEAWYMGFVHGADPDPYPQFHSEGGFNDFHYENERVDELLEKGRRTLDVEERSEIYEEFQQIWNEDLPVVPTHADIEVFAVSERLRGINPDPGVVDPLEDGYLYREMWIPERYREQQ